MKLKEVLSGKKEFDQKLFIKHKYISGIDEVGIGCVAGVATSAIITLDEDCLYIPEINDSKKLSEKKREYLYDKIIDNCIDYKILSHSVKTIDKLGIWGATRNLYKHLYKSLNKKPDLLIVDGNDITFETYNINSISECKADINWYVVGCASIIAKVHRDRIMIELSKQYPEYKFENHKGYCTKLHEEIVIKYGRIDGVHRTSFKFPFEKR